MAGIRAATNFAAAVAATEGILRLVRESGYAVSVFHMGGYVELHAVDLSGDHVPHVARCEGDGDCETYQAARVLAEMVGLPPAE